MVKIKSLDASQDPSSACELGITGLWGSRESYGIRLDNYLSGAMHSIDVIAISAILASEKGDLSDLFVSKLKSNKKFRIRLSILEAGSDAVAVLAESLGQNAYDFNEKIVDSNSKWKNFRQKLPIRIADRFQLTIRNRLLPFSIYGLDARLEAGLIRVEFNICGNGVCDSMGFETNSRSALYPGLLKAIEGVFPT